MAVLDLFVMLVYVSVLVAIIMVEFDKMVTGNEEVKAKAKNSFVTMLATVAISIPFAMLAGKPGEYFGEIQLSHAVIIMAGQLLAYFVMKTVLDRRLNSARVR